MRGEGINGSGERVLDPATGGDGHGFAVFDEDRRWGVTKERRRWGYLRAGPPLGYRCNGGGGLRDALKKGGCG